MRWTSFAAIYFVVWWVVLFAVLPWGVRSQHEEGEYPPGTDPGAPTAPSLGVKALWTTGITTVICGLFYWAFATRVLTLDDLATLWGLLK